MKRYLTCAALLLVGCSAWARQNPQVPLDFAELERKASNVVRVSLPKSLLSLAAGFIPKDDPDAAKIKKLVGSLQGVFVRSYEFDEADAFSPSDFEPLRKTLAGPGWNCLISVHTKVTAGHGARTERKGEDTDICLRQDGDKVLGLTILSTEAKKVTIVNILGDISPDDLALLKEFGVPDVEAGSKKFKEMEKAPKEKDKDDKVKDKDKDDRNDQDHMP